MTNEPLKSSSYAASVACGMILDAERILVRQGGRYPELASKLDEIRQEIGDEADLPPDDNRRELFLP